MRWLICSLAVTFFTAAGWIVDHSKLQNECHQDQADLSAIQVAAEQAPTNYIPLLRYEPDIKAQDVPDWTQVEALPEYKKASGGDRYHALSIWIGTELKAKDALAEDALTQDVLDKREIRQLIAADSSYENKVDQVIASLTPTTTDFTPKINALQDQVDDLKFNQNILRQPTADPAPAVQNQIPIQWNERPYSMFHDQTIIEPGQPIRTQTIIDDGN